MKILLWDLLASFLQYRPIHDCLAKCEKSNYGNWQTHLATREIAQTYIHIKKKKERERESESNEYELGTRLIYMSILLHVFCFNHI